MSKNPSRSPTLARISDCAEDESVRDPRTCAVFSTTLEIICFSVDGLSGMYGLKVTMVGLQGMVGEGLITFFFESISIPRGVTLRT